MGTNVPQLQFGPLGIIVPTESAILAGVLADFNQAFGGDLNLSLNTPQGQLASSLAAIIADGYAQTLQLFNGFDPAYNSGRSQDAIARIYFLERNPAQSTSVTVTCLGAEGTVIVAGSLVSDSSGNLYANPDPGTIPSGGSINIQFVNTVTGPIPCPAGAILSAPYRQLTGWDSASNSGDGVLGNDIESTQAFEARREASVALNAVAVVSAVRGNVLQVPGVLDCYVTENPTGSAVTIGGVSVAAHSLYVCTSGGASQAIAQAIWEKKNPGCAYTGNTTETVLDDNSGYSMPFPSYSVTFQIATPLTIIFAVSLATNALVPSNAAQLIQAAIINAFSGGDGGPRASIGSTIFASRFYAAVAALGSWVEIRSILIGSSNTTAAQFTGVISGTALTTSATTGTIAIGQTIEGTGVLDNTVIVSGSGTSWVVNNTQIVASTAMVGFTASLNSIATNINQAPAVAAPDITVTVS